MSGALVGQVDNPLDDDVGAVNAASLAGSVAGVSPGHHQDVLDSCLLTQLSVNEAADRFVAFEPWCGHYLQVLSEIGWPTQSMGYGQVSLVGRYVSLQNIVVKSISGITDPKCAERTDLPTRSPENPKQN